MGLVPDLAALAALLPAGWIGWRPQGRGAAFYAAVALAAAAPTVVLLAQLDGRWRTGFADALWVSVAATMAVFLLLAATTRHAWRLLPLLMPIEILFALLATLWQHLPERPLAVAVPRGWIDAHIFFALAAYALITIAAVAGAAVFLQERALKAKQPTRLTRLLPAVAESEALEMGLLATAEAGLALGVMSGMAGEHFLHGPLLPFDHKTLFSIAAFVVLGGLLIARRANGIRGRRVARLAVLAYVLLTLAYPGVKFITDVLLT